MILLGCTRT